MDGNEIRPPPPEWVRYSQGKSDAEPLMGNPEPDVERSGDEKNKLLGKWRGAKKTPRGSKSEPLERVSTEILENVRECKSFKVDRKK